ncbi:MAG: hemerythrin domain-containing protein [Rikenellaceae bacterium]
MSNMYKVWSYTPEDKMSDLICDNYPMLLVLNRFNISMGFSDSTIGEVCENHNVDTNTFLAIVNLLISEDKSSIRVDFSTLSLDSVILYLENSHSYFSEYKLPSIRRKLKDSLKEGDAVSLAILNYYDEYIAEVQKHMNYEENIVFTYVNDLLKGEENKVFNIDVFSDHHESVDSKLSELKNIIIKYYPVETTHKLSSVLFDIFNCESDLSSHNDIEDYILIPAIREIEKSKINKNEAK